MRLFIFSAVFGRSVSKSIGVLLYISKQKMQTIHLSKVELVGFKGGVVNFADDFKIFFLISMNFFLFLSSVKATTPLASFGVKSNTCSAGT